MVTAMRVLAMLGLIVMLRWWLLAAFVIAVIAFTLWVCHERIEQAIEGRRERRTAIAARAD